MKPIPILDLVRARKRIDAELTDRWRKILDASSYVQGPEVKEFECAFTGFLEARAVVGVGNGTDALVIALRALGLEPGDEVLVPAFSFFATAEAVFLAGGRPVFCDIDAATYNLDPAELERQATPRTVGVIGVHLYGRPFDCESVATICRANGWFLIEDAAQAHGARRRGRRVGTIGDLAAWSFYPTKNLGALGDAGALLTNDDELMRLATKIRVHGSGHTYFHEVIGGNFRIDALQAALLKIKLRRLEEITEQRRRVAHGYNERLKAAGVAPEFVKLPQEVYGRHVYHQYVLRAQRRDELMSHLKARHIGCGVYYPLPLHEQQCFKYLGYERGAFPHSEQAAAEVLALPMYPELTGTQQDIVVDAIRAFYK